MIRSLALILFATPLAAEVPLQRIVEDHILPGYEALATESATLADVAEEHCAPDDAVLREAYNDAFDAWIAVSHLRFGPSEVGDRAFSLAFWPDSRGATPSALNGLIADADPVVETEEGFADVSVAARGFYAMEFLLYDETLSTAGDPDYHCALVQAVARDIASVSATIRQDWTDGYGTLIATAGENDTYRSTEEAAQELFKAVNFGLEFTSDTRLGRPMGTFDRPRPARAEAWRSGRSLRHVRISLDANRELALMLAADAPETQANLDVALTRAIERADALDDPIFAGVEDPQGRFAIEALQTDIQTARRVVSTELGPVLGVAAGFNSLDGD
ncbi:imelysin family protein [Pelagovum pacificum]|uniref:Peptidase M75 n=1 Tax=Pelagovum pacificum TaxID=2588711 RepID=A0A5C5GFR9_9RHOB|nr:imelysin family protein [Pelagovum pacificum]QQA43806.1 imelysin family protein [Pelagovum pacificum]TNY33064.1 peptidase M75 [Pelagovum pacificum]